MVHGVSLPPGMTHQWLVMLTQLIASHQTIGAATTTILSILRIKLIRNFC